MPITEIPFTNLLNFDSYANPNLQIVNKLFTCGFQLGYSDENISYPGATASGFMAVLNAISYAANAPDQITNSSIWTAMFTQPSDRFIFNENFYFVNEPQTNRIIWIIRGRGGAEILLQNLNVLHANIAGLIAAIDPANSPEMSNLSIESPDIYENYVAAFNRFKNFTFIGSYQTGANDSANYSSANSGNYSGNGITQFFVLSDQDQSKWQLSRAGVELQVLLNYLNYGGIAVVAPTWKSLLNYNLSLNIAPSIKFLVETSAQNMGYGVQEGVSNVGLFSNNLEAVVSLENGGLIERRHTIAGYGITGSNRVSYASQLYTYKNSGVSAALIYGLTGSELLNVHSNPNDKGSFLSTFMDNEISGIYSNIPIFHSGFSGTDLTINQRFTDINSVYRYCGLDGISGLKPESTSIDAGLTTYQLVDDENYDSLNRLFCIFGKNAKEMPESALNLFYPSSKGQNLIVKVPAISDVVGILAYNKAFKSNTEGGLFSSPLGISDGRVLNGTIEPIVKYTSTTANTLRTRRINFFDYDVYGSGNRHFLASEFTGATGQNPNNTDRFSTLWLIRTIRDNIISVLTSTYSNLVKSTVKEQIIAETDSIIQNNYSQYLLSKTQGGWLVEWPEALNASSLTVVYLNITIKPKTIILGYTPKNTIGSFNIRIGVSLD